MHLPFFSPFTTLANTKVQINKMATATTTQPIRLIQMYSQMPIPWENHREAILGITIAFTVCVEHHFQSLPCQRLLASLTG